MAIIWKANRNHTQGHSSSLATWSKTQRQLVEPRGDKPSAGRPPPRCPISSIYVSFPLPLSAERQRQSAQGSRQAGVRKISCCYGNASQRRTGAVCRVRVGGALSVSLETALRPLHLHHAVHEQPQEARGQEVQRKRRSEKKKKKKKHNTNKSFSMTRRQKSSYC